MTQSSSSNVAIRGVRTAEDVKSLIADMSQNLEEFYTAVEKQYEIEQEIIDLKERSRFLEDEIVRFAMIITIIEFFYLSLTLFRLKDKEKFFGKDGRSL